MTENEIRVLTSLVKVTEKLSDLDKGRLLGFGECMATDKVRDSTPRKQNLDTQPGR
ncbi:hypothetical protein [Allofournierella sp.]|uniref:hypothetical protein n=1 Tax=Allofournierella sp. TaxID=1940256 RepID=UPI003AEF7D56